MNANPFLVHGDLPYDLPPFDRIRPEHFPPAFEQGMAEQMAEVEAIVSDPEPPTFANTMEALERSGRLLDRVRKVFFTLSSAHTDDAIAAIEAEIAPRLAAHDDAILLNRKLFERISRLYETRDELDLDPESRYLIERYHADFVRAGAALEPARQLRLRELNEELSRLSTVFKERLLADTNASAVVVEDRARLEGLADDAVAAAAEAARARGRPGAYVLSLILPTGQPALSSLADRDLRRRLFEASIGRCARGDENDTREIASRMLRLRAERARLLGHPHHASYVIADQTAGTVEAVDAMLGRITPAAVANARAEADLLREAAGPGFDLRPWDWAYYSEQVRRRRYDVDAAELRPYFELERVVHDGVFFAAHKLYGLSFVERFDLPTYHPEVRVFEVFEEDGSPLGLFLADYFARESKRGGAWMNSLVERSGLFGQRPVVVNTLNLNRPPAGEPALLTFDEVRTLFHEFGHALHGLFSDVRHPRFAGTRVPRDFVEYPSQVNEMWALWPEVLANYARHHVTGEPLAPEKAERLRAARLWGEGFATTEYVAAALLDLALHRLGPEEVPSADGIEDFEREVLERAGIAAVGVPPRYRTTYFSHIFAGGYSAAYYSYIWSQVFDADTVRWFEENGGLDRTAGERFRRAILSRGGGLDAKEAFRRLRGRDPELEPLLERRGLI